MAKRIISRKGALIHRLKLEEKPITLVLGSAISKKQQNGVGIPDVLDINSYIADFLSKKNLTADYNEFLDDNELNDNYQSGFEFIASVLGQNSINAIINEIVLSNVDPVTNKHGITKAINDLASYIKSEKINIKNIITTNFDTLLEESFEENLIPKESISIVSDSHINMSSSDNIRIVHIHGVWNKNDTMHSYSQLNAERNKVEASLQELFLDTSVYIMAYSGWDDSFTRALSNIVNLQSANYSIAWCFYSESNSSIEDDFSDWFKELNPAISRGRIQFFKGIDCNTLFEEANSTIAEKKSNNTRE